MSFLDLTSLLGGLAIFLYGMEQARDSLQLVAGARLRSIIARVTDNRLLGLATGAAVTMLLQSSSATSVMLVNFAATGLMTVAQAMSVTLGAGIGTTVTVQLISFKVSSFALGLIALGFGMMFVARRRRMRHFGQLVLAFGFIFFGMKIMGEATAPLKDAELFQALLGYLGANPLAALLVAAAFTGVVQASAATIGLLLSLAVGGTLGLDVALPMVLGANVGTAVTAMLASIGTTPEGKRVAFAQLIYKTMAAGICFFMLPQLEAATLYTSDDLVRQIANAHTIFNVVAAFAFLPFTGLAATALTRWYNPAQPSDAFRPKYLDPRSLDTPPLAFGHATREFTRMADLVSEMLVKSLRVFETKDLDLIAEVEATDDKVDILNREIKLYLARLTQRDLSPEEAERELELVTLSSQIEGAGDLINKNILSLGNKYITRQLQFSDDGWKEIRGLYKKVLKNFDVALVAFSTSDETLARQVLRYADNFQRIESDLRQAHLKRLHQAVPETFETSAIHMDLITYLVRINEHIAQLAEVVLKDQQRRGVRSSD